MTTLVTKKVTRPDGRTALETVALTREAEHLGEIGRTKRVVRTEGDLSVTDTSFAFLTGMRLQVTVKQDAKVFVAVHCYGKAAANQDLRTTLFLDGSNMAGVGGLGYTEVDKASCLNVTGLTGKLSAGNHTIELHAKINGGTGTIFASLASIPLAISGFVIHGDAPFTP